MPYHVYMQNSRNMSLQNYNMGEMVYPVNPSNIPSQGLNNSHQEYMLGNSVDSLQHQQPSLQHQHQHPHEYINNTAVNHYQHNSQGNYEYIQELHAIPRHSNS